MITSKIQFSCNGSYLAILTSENMLIVLKLKKSFDIITHTRPLILEEGVEDIYFSETKESLLFFIQYEHARSINLEEKKEMSISIELAHAIMKERVKKWFGCKALEVKLENGVWYCLTVRFRIPTWVTVSKMLKEQN